MGTFKIVKIGVEGFRGYNTKKELLFEKPITLLYGHNGVGKSSTVTAVEWCLFGDVAYLLHLEGRAKDEIVNQFSTSGSAKVTLELSDGAQTYTISRSKRAGSSKTDLKIIGPDLDADDEEAEQQIFKIFEITLDDFIRSTYLHQESIKGLLVEDAALRDEALDRLFGLERIRNIMQSIPIKRVRDSIEDLEQKKTSIERKIEGAVEQIQSDLEKLRSKASDLGVYKAQQAQSFCLSTSETILDRLKKAATDYDLPQPSFEAPGESSQVDLFVRKVKSNIRDMETRIIGTSKITDLSSEKSSLQNFKKQAFDIRKELGDNDALIKQLVSKYGQLDDITKLINSITDRIQEDERKRNRIDIESRLIDDATLVLHGVPYENCPICGQPIDAKKVLIDLEGRATTDAKSELLSLESDRAKQLREKEDLEAASGDLQRLFEDKKSILDSERKLLGEGEANLGTAVKSAVELIEVCDKRLAEIEEEMGEFNDAYQKRAASFDTIREDLEQLSAVSDVLKKEKDFDQISSHFKSESEEIKELASAITELKTLDEQLSLIIRSAAEVQVGLANQLINESESEIQSYYSRLCKHQAYADLRINVKSRELRGLVKNSYSIKAYNREFGKETYVSTRFSAGQMNAVALAVCFALSTILKLRFGFLILDDPAQTLDFEHKTALAKVLVELGKRKQIIVATQDEELLKLLSEEPTAGVVTFPSWSVEGPVTIQPIMQM